MKQLLWLAAAGLALLAASSNGQAREYQTLAVVSGASVDALADDLAFLGNTIQNPRLAENVGKALARQSRIATLEGVDRSRRWALALRTDGIDIAPLLLLPVTDLPALFQSLQPILGEVEPQESGLTKIGRGSFTGFVREHNGWAFVAQSPDRLTELPQAEAILEETPPDAWLAMILHVQRLPEAYRTMAIDNLRTMTRAAAERSGKWPGMWQFPLGIFDADLSTQAWQLTEQGLAEAERISLAVRLEQRSKSLSLELRMQPRADSALAAVVKEWGAPADGWMNLARDEAFQPRIELSMNAKNRASLSERMSRSRQTSTDGTDPPQAAADGSLAEWLSELAVSMSAPDRCRLTLLSLADRPPLTIAACCDVADVDAGDRLLKSLRKIVQSRSPTNVRAEPREDQPLLQDVIRCPLVGENLLDSFARLLGGDPELLVAARGERILLAAGPDAEKALSRLVEPRPDGGVPLELVFRCGTAAGLLGQLADDDRLRSIMSVAAINLRSADDRLSLLISRDGDEMLVQASAHEGVLRTLALGISVGVLQAMSAPPR